MLDKLKRLGTSEIIAGLVSLLLGGVVGAIIQDQLTNQIKWEYLTIGILSMTFIAIIALIRTSIHHQAIRYSELLKALKNIDEAVGLTVNYQDLKAIGKTDQIDYAKQLLQKAQERVLVLDRADPFIKSINPDLPGQELRRQYYSSILSHVREQADRGNKMLYIRICQFDKQVKFKSLKDRIFVDHCKEMILLSQKYYRVHIKQTILKSPMSFIIIDQNYLIVSIDRIGYQNGKPEHHSTGELIIYDPQQRLVKVFEDEWHRIEHSPQTAEVTLDDFST